MRERCEDNFVIWDLVHGVAISEIEISRNMRQRVKLDFMRDDFEGFSPLHVLALQGRVKILSETLRLRNKIKECFALVRGGRREERSSFFVGNRTFLHLLALGGHNRCLGSEIDEYGGSARDIAKIVSKKRGEFMGGRWLISHTHIDSLELLKIWISFRPERSFEETAARTKLVSGQYSPIKGDTLGVARVSGSLGFAAYARENLPQGRTLGIYKGLFNPIAFNSFLKEHLGLLVQKKSAIFPKVTDSTEYFSDMVDAKTFCSKEAFINDSVPPSVLFIAELAEKGLPFQTRCVTLRDIRKGEFLGAFYACHQMRMREDYVEIPEAISVRDAFIRGIQTKRDLSELCTYEKSGLNAVVATPQLVFRWLKSGAVSLSQIENIFRLYLQLRLNNEADAYATAFLLVIRKLKEPEFLTYFFQNWIDPILTNKDLIVSNNQDFMYKGLAVACMELVDAEILYAKTRGISLDITRVDESTHQCEVGVVCL
jgi:hypothetical protein